MTGFVAHEVQRAGRPVMAIRRPATVTEALQALEADPDARPIAGGTDLLLELQRTDETEPVRLVDLTGITGFRAIDETGSALRLGGGVTHAQVVASPVVRNHALPLAQACLEVGSPQLRNRATIAGNLVTASPANDTISALMALDADVELTSVAGTRQMPVADFFTGFRETALRAGELITAIVLPKLDTHERGLWVKVGLRRAQAISVVHAGLVVGLADDGTVSTARLALGSVAPTVVLVPEFADALVGKRLDAETAGLAAAAAAASIAPISDGRATATYRRDVVVTVIERSLDVVARGDHASTWPDDPPTLSSPDDSVRAPRPHVDQVDDLTEIEVIVNGSRVRAGRAASKTLLDWVRDEAGATGSKEGCAEGECGACTMVVDDAAVMSCLVSAAQADGAKVVTIEGLGGDAEPHPLQQAFVDEFAVQCGFCIPGFIVAGARLLDECSSPTRAQIEHGLAGNLCRCTGYYPIVAAIERTASEATR